MKCKHCAEEIDPNTETCPHCDSIQMKTCSYCKKQVAYGAKICKYCHHLIRGKNELITAKPIADYGVFLLAIPVMSAIAINFWVGSMSLLQFPSDKLIALLLINTLGTALLSAVEVKKNSETEECVEDIGSPVTWFFIITLCWPIGYPAYLYKRNRFGLTEYPVAGIVVSAVLIFVSIYVNNGIEQAKSNVLQEMENFRKQSEELINSYR